MAKIIAQEAVTITNAATLIATEVPDRVSILIQNNGTQVVYVGDSAVATTTGIILKAASAADIGDGGSVEFPGEGAVYGIVASGTSQVRVLHEGTGVV